MLSGYLINGWKSDGKFEGKILHQSDCFQGGGAASIQRSHSWTFKKVVTLICVSDVLLHSHHWQRESTCFLHILSLKFRYYNARNCVVCPTVK